MEQINQEIKFKYRQDIIEYDCGSLLSLAVTDDNIPVLEVWLDTDRETYNLYAYVFMRKQDVMPFVQDQKFYFDVLKDSERIVAFKYNSEKKYHEFHEMDKQYYLKNYGPKKSVSLKDDLVEFNESFNQFLEKDADFKASLNSSVLKKSF